MHALKEEFLALLGRDPRIATFFEEAGIWTWDLQKPEAEWMNAHFWQSLGYPAQVRMGQSWQQLIHPDDLAPLQAQLQAHLSDPSLPFCAVTRYRHQNGSTVWIRSQGLALRQANGQATLMLISYADITREKEAELRARQQALLYDSIVASQVLYVAKTDVAGRYTFVSDYYAQSLGLAPEAMVGELASRDVWEADVPLGLQAYAQCIREPEVAHTVILRKKDEPYRLKAYEWTFLGLKDERGEVGEILCLGRDVTQRQKTEQDLSVLVSSMSDVLAMVSAEGVLTYLSPSWQRNLGYEVSASLGEPLQRFVHPEDQQNFTQALQQAQLRGQSDLEHRFLHQSGAYVWVKTQVNQHEVTGDLVCTSHDLTERKRAEEELLKTQQLLGETAEIAQVGAWEYTVASQQLYWSPVTRQIHDEALDTLIEARHSIEAYTNEEGRRKIRQAVDEALRLGTPWDLEGEIITAQGRHKWVRSRGQAEFKKGQCQRLFGIFQDITEQKRAEQELLRTQKFLEETSRMAKVGGWEVSLPDRELYWTSVTKEIHELPADFEPDLATGLRFYVSTEAQQRIARLVEETIRTGQSWDVEEQIKTAQGNVRWVRALGQAEWREGRCTRIFGTFQDIDERKRAEEQIQQERRLAEAASRAKSEFLANMSHEIRTPLNGVIGFTELLTNTRLDDTQQQYMQMVLQSAQALMDIISDILDFSKIEAEKLQLNPEVTDLYELMGQAVAIITPQAHQKNLEVLLNVLAPTYVEVDGVRLRQILVNLLSNAVKFTFTGEIELKVETLDRPAGRVALRFSVRDTGIGIAPENQQRIFEAFTQEDVSTTKKFGGTGIGLTISNQLLGLMQSQLTLQSSPGLGSCFAFDVSLPVPDQEPERFLPLEPLKTALVGEANATQRQIISALLQRLGLHPTAVSSARQALQCLSPSGTGESRTFDVVLLDDQWPQAQQVLDELERLRPENRPAVLHLRRASNEEAVSSGMPDYSLSKPIELRQLYQALLQLQRTAPPASAPVPTPAPEVTPARLSILVVEDNTVNLLLAKKLIALLRPEAQIFEARDGRQALEQYAQTQPDLILMDIQMPEMNGYEATQAIRAREQAGQHVPILALTAGILASEKERCLEAGMDEYLTKPILRADLEAALAQWLPRP